LALAKFSHQSDEKLGRLHQTDQKMTMQRNAQQHHLEDLRQIRSEKTANRTPLKFTTDTDTFQKWESISYKKETTITMIV